MIQLCCLYIPSQLVFGRAFVLEHWNKPFELSIYVNVELQRTVQQNSTVLKKVQKETEWKLLQNEPGGFRRGGIHFM